MNEISWFFIGHMVCVSQWAAFLLVDRAYLGKGRVKHVGFWSVVLVAGMLAFSLIFQIGFFTLETVWYNVGYVLLSTLLFGGTLPQKLTAALINGTMCLLSENTVRYVVSWVTGTSLQVVWQRPGCLVTMTLTNFIVGVVVAYFSHQWKDERVDLSIHIDQVNGPISRTSGRMSGRSNPRRRWSCPFFPASSWC